MLTVLVCTAQTPSPTRQPLQAPPSFVVVVDVRNGSKTCARITTYWARPLIPWTKQATHNFPPNSKFEYRIRFAAAQPHPVAAQIKVVAQYMSDIRCSEPVVRQEQSENKRVLPPRTNQDAVITFIATGPPHLPYNVEMYCRVCYH